MRWAMLTKLRCVPAAPDLLAALFREIDTITRDTIIEAVTLLDIDAVVEALQSPFDATDKVAIEAVFGLAFLGLRDRPIPVGRRRALLPALGAITALAGE
jgi:hypothetical protein